MTWMPKAIARSASAELRSATDEVVPEPNHGKTSSKSGMSFRPVVHFRRDILNKHASMI
jgi:hypothetical protein